MRLPDRLLLREPQEKRARAQLHLRGPPPPSPAMQLQRLSVPVAAASGCPSGKARLQPPPLARPRALHHICRAGPTPSSSAGFFGEPSSQSNLPLAAGTAPPNTEAGRAYWRTLWEARTAVKSSAPPAPPAAAAAEEEVVSNVSAAKAVELAQASSPAADPAIAEVSSRV